MSLLWTSEAMIEAMNGRPVGALPEGITGISIDTRTLRKGEAFFAIKGDARTQYASVVAVIDLCNRLHVNMGLVTSRIGN